MEYKEILAELKKKIYRPIYLLEGEEPYYIDLISDYIENNVLSEDERAFNQKIIYGKDTNADEINALARQYPFAADYQVIIIKEAQNIKDLSDLIYYAEKPLKPTILVLCHKYKKLDGKTKFVKELQKSGCILVSEKVKDYQLSQWIQDYLKEQKLTYEIGIPDLLASYLGNDLHKIINEISKLRQSVPDLQKITRNHIETYIGISKQYSDFELCDAFGTKNADMVFKILNVYASNPKEFAPQRTIINLYSFFKNLFLMCYLPPNSTDAEIGLKLGLNPYIVKIRYRAAKNNYSAMKLFTIISLIREYDMKTKGVDNGNTEPTELIRELALKILY